jgi:hypothetical protein
MGRSPNLLVFTIAAKQNSERLFGLGLIGFEVALFALKVETIQLSVDG